MIVIADAERNELLCIALGGVGVCSDPEPSPLGGSTPNPAPLILEGVTDPTRMFGVTRFGSETILGIEHDCYTCDGPESVSAACVSKQGFMLRADRSVAGQGARLEAVDFSDDASDEDSEAPCPIADQAAAAPSALATNASTRCCTPGMPPT